MSMDRNTIRNTILLVYGAALIARAVFLVCGFDAKCFQEKGGLVGILEEYLSRKISK